MKITKPLIIAAFAAGSLLVSGLTLQAQGATNAPPPPLPAGGPPPGRPPGTMGMRGRPDFDAMARQLNLTDDQKTKFKSIMDARMQKMRGLRQDPDFAGMAPQERGAKMKAIQDDADAQIKALLTPDQFEKWQKMPRMGMRGPRTIPPPGSPNTGTTNAPVPPDYKGPQK